MRIAIANDMPLAVEALRRALAAEPEYQLIWVASNGEEAVSRCREDRPELLLMDMLMPGMDGVAMLEQMHADPELKDVPVVMLTAEGQKEIAERAIALGSRGYLRKPFGNDVLISHVRTIIPLAAKPAAVPA